MLISTSLDLEADALYIKLARGKVARTVDVDSGTLVDVDEAGRPLGIEVIHPAREWPLDEILRTFGIDTATAQMLGLTARSFHSQQLRLSGQAATQAAGVGTRLVAFA